MSKTILCADDSATMQTVAEITFNATEYQYVGARTADEALQKARQSTPALILADAIMPGKSGYDLCKEIKADPALAGVPVLVVCGNSEKYDEARGAQAGADGHVVKPWDTQKLMDQIGEVLGAGGAARPKPVAAAAPSAPARPKAPSAPPAQPAAPMAAAPGTHSHASVQPPRNATLMGIPAAHLPMVNKPVAPAQNGGGMAGGTNDFEADAEKTTVAQAPSVAARPAAPKPAAPQNGSRPAMIGGTPAERPVFRPRPVPPSVEELAQAAGFDPNSPEMAAIMNLSRAVVERIVWEVVPDLAETIIRENIDRISPKVQ